MSTPPRDARGYRLANIDMLRGLVVVIMALDHVRDCFMFGAQQDPMSDPNIGAALFFTRWITHFCAPVFVFLAGTSAGLMGARKSPVALGVFLLKRGLWLVAVECFIISPGFTFAPWGIEPVGGRMLVIMQVIWAIGASMAVLAGAQFLGRRACLLLGAAIVAGHNLLDPIWPGPTSPFDVTVPLWHALHTQMAYVAGPFHLFFAYPVLPWVGVMLLGFGAAGLFEAAPVVRDRRLLTWGVGLTAAFLVLRLAGVYGDPNPWTSQAQPVSTLIDLLNTTKYPPSLLFLLMTLGPSAILCALTDRAPDAIKDRLIVFGRVPFAFYVVHFYLIHTGSLALGVLQGFAARDFLTIMLFYPKGYGLALPGVYLVWALVVLALYPLCRWVASVKARRRDWWLSYV